MGEDVKKIGRYEILDKLGQGAMGIVYKANQRSMARTVALKILAPKYASRPNKSPRKKATRNKKAAKANPRKILPIATDKLLNKA